MPAAASYYYEQLGKEQKKAYYAMKTGLEAMAPSFPVPRLSGKELADIYFLIRLDHPEIFYSVKFNYRYYPDSEFVEFIPEYLFAKVKLKEHQQAMSARVNKLTRQIREQKTDAEKIIFIHDFLCENVHYDKLKKPYSHEIIGSLGNGTAVCEGIAKAVKVLCDAAGIWCIIALSDNNPAKGIRYRHTWNVIKLNGQYYHLDVTFDNSLHRSGVMRYDYVNLSDKQIYRDHEPSIYHLPACPDAGESYYRQKKLSFTKMEDVRKRSAQAAKKKKTLVFHWRGGYLTRAVLIEMLQTFREEACKKNLQAAVSVNWAQAIVMVRFEEKAQDTVGSDRPADTLVTGNSPEAEKTENSGEAKKEGKVSGADDDQDRMPDPIEGILMEHANEEEEDAPEADA